MKVLPINQQTQIYQNNNRRVNFRGGLTQDVVNISKKDFLSLPEKELWVKIRNSMTELNSLGHGGEAEVWRIEGTDYCVRIPHWTLSKLYNAPANFDLTEQDKINHVVAKFYQGVTIMPVLNGYTFYNSKDKDSKEIAEMVENMPQKAFDDLFLQIYHAEKAKMIFDTGANNIIINPENQTLTALDFRRQTCWSEKNRILYSIYYCFEKTDSMDDIKNKHFAGKILTAALNSVTSEPKRNIDLEKCGFDSFIESSVVDKNSAKILLEHLNEITRLNKENAPFEEHEKFVRTMIKQLFFNV